jgi:hypothetical protein
MSDTQVDPSKFEVAIVVANNGFVYVGRVEYRNQWETHNIFTVVVHDARVVRRWGTKHGLAEIATLGPTSETILDMKCTVRIHPLAVVSIYDCEQSRWSAHV